MPEYKASARAIGALFIIASWLIVKGFNATPAFTREPDKQPSLT